MSSSPRKSETTLIQGTEMREEGWMNENQACHASHRSSGGRESVGRVISIRDGIPGIHTDFTQEAGSGPHDVRRPANPTMNRYP